MTSSDLEEIEKQARAAMEHFCDASYKHTLALEWIPALIAKVRELKYEVRKLKRLHSR